ncbi:MAG: hypothetical protein H8D43_03510 [Chloroflexi bacterium]|nr:hypothetical protein [Chloroflexota bacterium]
MSTGSWADAYLLCHHAVRFAREVGSIVSHYAELKGENAEPEPSYRFYM